MVCKQGYSQCHLLWFITNRYASKSFVEERNLNKENKKNKEENKFDHLQNMFVLTLPNLLEGFGRYCI